METNDDLEASDSKKTIGPAFSSDFPNLFSIVESLRLSKNS